MAGSETVLSATTSTNVKGITYAIRKPLAQMRMALIHVPVFEAGLEMDSLATILMNASLEKHAILE